MYCDPNRPANPMSVVLIWIAMLMVFSPIGWIGGLSVGEYVSTGGNGIRAVLAGTSSIDGTNAEILWLEHFLIFENLRGFPLVGNSDSRYRLEKEASLYDETSFE